jgi:hypothetical protein
MPPSILPRRGSAPVALRPAALPRGDTRDWARRSVEKIRTAYLAGRFHLLPWLDVLTEETPEIRGHYRVMLREPTLQAALKTQVLSVASQEVQAHPEDAEDPRQQQLARALLYAIKQVHGGSPNLPLGRGPRHIAWSILSGAVMDGWSLCEVTLRERPERTGPCQGKVLWDQLKAKDTSHVQLTTDRFWNIEGVRAPRFNPGVVFTGADLESFIVYNHLSFFEQPIGISGFRAAYRAFWIKDTAWKLRALFLDRHATPGIKAGYTSIEQKAALEEAFEDWKTSGFITYPVGAVIEALDIAGRGAGEFQSAIDDCNKEMLTAVCGAYLHMMEGTQSDVHGNSEVQQETTELFRWALTASLGDVVTAQMARPWVAYNYHGMECPDLTWGTVSESALTARAQLDKALQEIGLQLSQKEAYSYYGRQRPTDPKDVLTPKGAGGGGGPPGMPGAPPGGPPGQGPPQQPQGQEDSEEDPFADLFGQGEPSAFGEEFEPDHWYEAARLSAFGEGDWTRTPGPRSQRRWVHKSGRVVYSDTNPGASKRKGKVKEAKPAKLTVDAAHAHIQALINKPPADMGVAVQELAQHLMGLTVKDLGALKGKLGLKASGAKLEYATKIAERALAGAKVEKKPPAAKKPPAKKKVEPPTRQGFGHTGDSPLAGLAPLDRARRVVQMSYDYGAGDSPDHDPLGVLAGAPPGMDLAAFGADLREAIDANTRAGGLDLLLADAYPALGRKYDLSKYDFMKAVGALHEAGDVRFTHWGRPLDELPDPDLIAPVGAKTMAWVRPGPKAKEPEPQTAEFIPDEEPPRTRQEFERAFDDAFDRLDRERGGHNQVSLVKLRAAVPADRAAFDGWLNEMRRDRKYSLVAAEGRFGISAEERRDGITEDGTLKIWIERTQEEKKRRAGGARR